MKFERALENVIKVGLVLGGAAMMFMMLATVTDVILRVFRLSYIGSYEIVEIFIVIPVAAALPYTTLKKGHVVIDLLLSRFKEKPKSFLIGVTTILTLAVWALILWASFGMMQEKWSGESSFQLGIPYLPFRMIWLAGLILFCVTWINQIINSFKTVRAK